MATCNSADLHGLKHREVPLPHRGNAKPYSLAPSKGLVFFPNTLEMGKKKTKELVILNLQIIPFIDNLPSLSIVLAFKAWKPLHLVRIKPNESFSLQFTAGLHIKKSANILGLIFCPFLPPPPDSASHLLSKK